MWMDSLNLADCLQALLMDFITHPTGIQRILGFALIIILKGNTAMSCVSTLFVELKYEVG